MPIITPARAPGNLSHEQTADSSELDDLHHQCSPGLPKHMIFCNTAATVAVTRDSRGDRDGSDAESFGYKARPAPVPSPSPGRDSTAHHHGTVTAGAAPTRTPCGFCFTAAAPPAGRAAGGSPSRTPCQSGGWPGPARAPPPLSAGTAAAARPG